MQGARRVAGAAFATTVIAGLRASCSSGSGRSSDRCSGGGSSSKVAVAGIASSSSSDTILRSAPRLVEVAEF